LRGGSELMIILKICGAASLSVLGASTKLHLHLCVQVLVRWW